MSRRRKLFVSPDSEQSVYVLSPEDVVLSKLDRYRRGGEVSERQWRDVLGVLKVRAGELDLDYMRTWASRLGVGELLERALEGAGAEAPGH